MRGLKELAGLKSLHTLNLDSTGGDRRGVQELLLLPGPARAIEG